VLLSDVRAAEPFAPVPADAPGRYQLLARGGVDVAYDADVYSIGRLQPGDVLTVSLAGFAGARGSLGDGLVEVFRHEVDAAGVFRVAANDDDGPGADAFLYRYPVATDDAYYIRARSANTSTTGTYELAAWLEDGAATPPPSTSPDSVATEAEPNESAGDAVDVSAAWRAVASMSTNAGNVVGTGAAAYDEYGVQLRAGDLVSLAVDSTSSLDAAVTFLGPDGEAVCAEDADSVKGVFGDRRDAGVFACTIPTAGTYRVRVLGNRGTVGAYRLDVLLSREPEPPPALVVARHVFYNNSYFDGRSPLPGPTDDRAVAPDKVALLPGRVATLGSVTNAAQGLNGVMIDVAALRRDPSPVDFRFEVSVPDAPGAWLAAPVPAALARRRGAGVNGADRVSVVWADGAIVDRWLRVTFVASAATGLPADDVFQFGNLVGESGDAPAAPFAVVGLPDVLATRARQSPGADITDWNDFNRDGRVNALDLSVARAHVGHGLSLPRPAGAAAEAPNTPPPRPRGAASRRMWYERDGSSVGL
jgi:hypothetical protein